MRTNTKTKAPPVKLAPQRLAGGMGPQGASQSPQAELRRLVMACLLHEKNAYAEGGQITERIAKLVPVVPPQIVANIAASARHDQGLRHVPLFVAREMARHKSHRRFVGALLESIIVRADEIAEFMAMYWKDGKQPIAKQVKVGLAAAFLKFSEYQLAKYNRDADITLRDVLFLVHPAPRHADATRFTYVNPISKRSYQRGFVRRHAGSLFDKLVHHTLAVPNTWEVRMSSGEDPKAMWEDLLMTNQLPALAFMRNLSKMERSGVSDQAIMHGFSTIRPGRLLPLDYLAAARHAPRWVHSIEAVMTKGFNGMNKLPGYTVIIVDVSGSMQKPISENSEFRRIDACAAMAMLAVEQCERSALYCTGGDRMTHKTALMGQRRGFGIIDQINQAHHVLGLGGIFTRQVLEYTRQQEKGRHVDRVIVLSDSQDCERSSSFLPQPYGITNYIVDVSAHGLGVNYDRSGWTSEVSGWSSKFINYIMALENVSAAVDEDQ